MNNDSKSNTPLNKDSLQEITEDHLTKDTPEENNIKGNVILEDMHSQGIPLKNSEDPTVVQPQNPSTQSPEFPQGVPTVNPIIKKQDFGVIGEGTSPILSVSHITKNYGKHTALDDVSLDIYGGRIVGLLGPNGSGKTTLIKLIAGLLHKTSGQILVDNFEPGVHTKSIVSYLPERSHLDENMRVRDVVAYFSDFYADFDSQRATVMLGHLGIDLHSIINSLSKGTKEKVQLILVMSRRARLYLLDEPIGGVDPASRDYILRTIISNYSPDSAVVLSTHLIHDIEQVLDDVIFINGGKLILTSTVEDIRESQGKSVDQLFREVFQC